MRSSHLPLAAAVFALSSSALPESGPNKSGPGSTPEALQISEDAGRNPNASTSVTFSRVYNSTQETWNWRINITELAVPDRISDLGEPSANFSQGLHVANTQWQLEWPGDDDDLPAFLAKRRLTASFTAMISNKPYNITKGYNASDNGNCTSILGEQCAGALAEAASRDSKPMILGLEGCENTLDVYEGSRGGSAIGFDIDPTDPSSNETAPPLLHRDDTLFYHTSDTYNVSDSMQFQQAKSALHVFIMNFEHEGPDFGEIGVSSGPSILCRIVDNSEPDSPSEDDPNQPSNDDPDSPSTAASLHHSTAALWGMVVLSILVLM